MTIGNAGFDLADFRAEQEREAGIKRVQAVLEATGTNACIDCYDEITPARRKAMPSTKRCIKCQMIHENGRGLS